MVDERLLEHWTRQRAARARLRNSLPRSWQEDSRPKMGHVRELYVESMLELRRPVAGTVTLGDDDR
jgi:hypothetical protein